MENVESRRSEQRLYYDWPVRFSRDFGEPIVQGRMANVSSRGAAFTCRTEQNCSYPGQPIVVFFSVPRSGSERVNVIRTACTCRVDKVDRYVCRIAVRFSDPLPFKPMEIAGGEFDATQKLQPVSRS
ncbi:MAG: PilZ domain-containing protein [Planctomycetota bacterium]